MSGISSPALSGILSPRAGRGRGEGRSHPALRSCIPSLAVALLALAAPAVAADSGAGRTKAQACTPCHGANGLSTQPNAPNLAGQPAIYVAEQLRAYRAGRRNHEVMTVVARGLGEGDIDDLAAWFESIQLEAKPPG